MAIPNLFRLSLTGCVTALMFSLPVTAQDIALRANLSPVEGQDALVQYTLSPQIDPAQLQPGDAVQMVNDLAAHGYTYAVHHAGGDWVCSVDLNTLTCSATVDAEGAISIPEIRVAARSDTGGSNCATLKLSREGADDVLRRSCIDPDGSVRDAALALSVPAEATCIAPQNTVFGCSLNAKITNTDDRPFSGAIAVNGSFDGTLQAIDARSNHMASCTALSSNTSSCYIPEHKIEPGASVDLTLGIMLPPQPADQVEACFNFGASGDPVLQVVQVQSALAAQGLNPGGIDGRAGPLTRDAVARLQAREGLEETGEIDDNVLFLLGLTAQAQAEPSCVALILQKEIVVAGTSDEDTDDTATETATETATDTAQTDTDAEADAGSDTAQTDTADENPEAPKTAQAEDRPTARPSDLKQPEPAAEPVQISCRRGTTLRGGRCVAVEQASACDPETAAEGGFGCTCLYRGMVQISMTRCICPRGTTLVGGAGCVAFGRLGG